MLVGMANSPHIQTMQIAHSYKHLVDSSKIVETTEPRLNVYNCTTAAVCISCISVGKSRISYLVQTKGAVSSFNQEQPIYYVCVSR